MAEQNKSTPVCPESTIDSAPRRDFIRRAALVAAGASVGAAIAGKNPVITAGATSQKKMKPDCKFFCCTCRCCILACCNILVDYDYPKYKNSNSLTPGMQFGGSGSGEGISMSVAKGSINRFGLCFWTNNNRQMSITSCGNIGIGTATPANKLCVNGTINAQSQVLANCYGGKLGGISGSSKDCYGAVGSTYVGDYAVRGVAESGYGVLAENTGNYPTAKFKNSGAKAGFDKSALILFQTGDSTPLYWEAGVGGSCSAIGYEDNSFFLFQNSLRMVIDSCGVTYADPGDCNMGTLHPGPSVAFGGTGTGEGIASNRCSCIPNQYGLCFYTNSPPNSPKTARMSIAHSGNVGIGTQAPALSLQIVGSFGAKMATVTAAYQMTSNDFGILANATSKAFTVTLPPAATADGMIVFVKKVDSTKHKVTVAASGSDKINGLSSESLAKQYDSLTLISNGISAWYYVASGT
jgi:hypothetical protein